MVVGRGKLNDEDIFGSVIKKSQSNSKRDEKEESELKKKKNPLRIYSRPNDSIAILEKDNDDLGLALAAADIAVTHKNKNAPSNGLKSLSLDSNQNRTGYQVAKSGLKQTTSSRFVQTKRGCGTNVGPNFGQYIINRPRSSKWATKS